MEGPCGKCVFPLEEEDSFKGIDGSTSLILAMRNDHKQCVNSWIESGADVNIADENGTTALFIAIWKKDLISVKKLIEAGADVNILNNDGKDPLREAVLGDFDACLDPLITAGADVNSDLNHFDGIPTSALMDAVQKKSIKCVTILLESGANVNKTCDKGKGALHYAACIADCKYTELLLNAGADVNIVDKYNHTALTLASLHGHHDSVEKLIDAGADVNHVAKLRNTALMLACHSGHIKAAEMLIKAGADVNTENHFGATALFVGRHGEDAAQYKRCVKALLRAGIQINNVNRLGRNTLPKALRCKSDDYALAKLLFAAGETLENIEESKLPDCLKFEDLKLQLKHICREAIRKHLLNLNPHQDLFRRIPKLGLPKALTTYLLFNETLEEEEFDNRNVKAKTDRDI